MGDLEVFIPVRIFVSNQTKIKNVCYTLLEK